MMQLEGGPWLKGGGWGVWPEWGGGKGWRPWEYERMGDGEQ